jgi:hypothetical protein
MTARRATALSATPKSGAQHAQQLEKPANAATTSWDRDSIPTALLERRRPAKPHLTAVTHPPALPPVQACLSRVVFQRRLSRRRRRHIPPAVEPPDLSLVARAVLVQLRHSGKGVEQNNGCVLLSMALYHTR